MLNRSCDSMYTMAKCTHVSGIEMILQKKLNFTLSYKKKKWGYFRSTFENNLWFEPIRADRVRQTWMSSFGMLSNFHYPFVIDYFTGNSVWLMRKCFEIE